MLKKILLWIFGAPRTQGEQHLENLKDRRPPTFRNF